MVIGEWSVDELAVPSRKITRCARSGLPVCYGRCAGGTTDCRLRGVCLTKARPGSGLFFFSEGLRQSRTLDMQLVATPCARLAERVTIGRALSRYKMITPPRPNDGQPRQSASPSCPTREARPRHPFLQDVQRRGSGVTNRDFVERPFPLR
jgi:hypothetical protein